MIVHVVRDHVGIASPAAASNRGGVSHVTLTGTLRWKVTGDQGERLGARRELPEP
jgi:hypothetical protein